MTVPTPVVSAVASPLMSFGTLFQQALPLGRTRPLDEIGRQRVFALLLAGRDEAAVRAYRESTHASHRQAVTDVRTMRGRLASAERTTTSGVAPE